MFVYIIDADFRLDDPNVINQQLLTFITSDPYVIQRQRILTSTAADKLDICIVILQQNVIDREIFFIFDLREEGEPQ